MNAKTSLLIVAAAVLVVPLVAVSGRAQSNGSRDGLYAYPDADQAARNKSDAPSRRAAESFRDSLDSASQQIKTDGQNAMAVREEIRARKSAALGLGATQGPGWLPDASDLSERGWIVVLAALGILISTSAAGYLWWSRRQQANMPVAVLMPMKPRTSPAGISAAADNSKEPKRRAA